MPMTDQRPLILLARIACDPMSADQRQLPPLSHADWSELLGHAGREGMDGLLHDWLSHEGLMPTVPPDIRQRLQRNRAHRLLDYQIKRGALEELLLRADGAGFRLLILQGMALAEELYPPGTRPLSDIDLLVRPDEFDRVVRLLVGLGYTAVSRYPPVYARNGVSIDLHQQLAYLSRVEPAVNPLRIDEAMLWADAVRRPFGSAMAWVLSPVDQVVILSAHLQKHSFSRLIWFVDIGRLLNRLLKEQPLDAIRERAAQLKLDQPLYFVCAYLREVLNLPSLQSVLLRPPPLNWAERRLAAWLTGNHRIDGMGDLLYLLSIRSPSARRQFLRQTILPNTGMMREQVRSSSAMGMAWGYVGRFGLMTWRAVRLTGRLVRSSLQAGR